MLWYNSMLGKNLHCKQCGFSASSPFVLMSSSAFSSLNEFPIYARLSNRFLVHVEGKGHVLFELNVHQVSKLQFEVNDAFTFCSNRVKQALQNMLTNLKF